MSGNGLAGTLFIALFTAMAETLLTLFNVLAEALFTLARLESAQQEPNHVVHPPGQGAAAASLTSSLESSLRDSLQCTICQDIFKDPVVTPYGNTFCRKCVSRWLERESTCPTSRRSLHVQQLAPNYQIKQVLDILPNRQVPQQVFDRADPINESSSSTGRFNTITNHPPTAARPYMTPTSRSIIPPSPILPQRAATMASLGSGHEFWASPEPFPRSSLSPVTFAEASPVSSPLSSRSQLTFAEASPVPSSRSSLSQFTYPAMAPAAPRRAPAAEPCITRPVCMPDPVCVPSSSRSARFTSNTYVSCSSVERSERVPRSCSSRSGGCQPPAWHAASISSSSTSTRRIDIRGLGTAEVHKGPRGGEYYYNSHGNKSYVKESQRYRIH